MIGDLIGPLVLLGMSILVFLLANRLDRRTMNRTSRLAQDPTTSPFAVQREFEKGSKLPFVLRLASLLMVIGSIVWIFYL